jgi:hypothetical protein
MLPAFKRNQDRDPITCKLTSNFLACLLSGVLTGYTQIGRVAYPLFLAMYIVVRASSPVARNTCNRAHPRQPRMYVRRYGGLGVVAGGRRKTSVRGGLTLHDSALAQVDVHTSVRWAAAGKANGKCWRFFRMCLGEVAGLRCVHWGKC